MSTMTSLASPVPPPVPGSISLPGVAPVPTNSSLTPSPPSIPNVMVGHDRLQVLEQLTNETTDNLNRLTGLLGPLSPSGRVPGVDHQDSINGGAPGEQDYFGNSFDALNDLDQFIDLNQYNHTDDYPSEQTGTTSGLFDTDNLKTLGADGSDFDFNLGSPGMGGTQAGADVGAVPLGHVGDVPGAADYMTSIGSGTASAGATSLAASPSAGSSGGTEEIMKAENGLPARNVKRRRVD